MITDSLGTILEQHSFDPWGKRRARNLPDLESLVVMPFESMTNFERTSFTLSALSLTSQFTNKGFTGHEQMDGVGLVHMGGRVYDAEIGRFLSADPFVQDRTSLQNLNRYTYVNNNPLSYTDPSGYFFKKLGKKLWKVVKTIANPLTYIQLNYRLHKKALRKIAEVEGLSTVISVGLNFIPGCQAWCSMVFNAAMTAANGGSIGDIATGAAIAFVTNGLPGGESVGGLTGALSEGLSALGKAAVPVSGMIVGGVAAKAQGGKFIDGVKGAAIGMAIAYGVNKIATMGEGKATAEPEKLADSEEPLSGRDKHYARNAENDAFLTKQDLHGRNDLTTDELMQKGFKHVGAPEDKFHTWGAGNENNQKWVFDNDTRYGSYEIVIRPSGQGIFSHVQDANVMGTLNYGGNPWTHFWRDVVPYYRYGNSPSDTTTGWQRFRRTFE